MEVYLYLTIICLLGVSLSLRLSAVTRRLEKLEQKLLLYGVE
jgi:hypothetical protein